MFIFAAFLNLIIYRMKNLLIFLTSCVIGVFFLISCNNQKAPEQASTTDSLTTGSFSSASISDGSVVYVELDSLTANYLMTKDLSDELEEKMKKLQADLTNRERVFQTNVRDFENKATKGLETRAKLAEMEQQLNIDQQNLLQISENYRMEMAEEQAVMQRKILQAIMDYLKEYNKDKKYSYIFGNAFDAKILYADPALDITASVLDGINAKYKAEKK